MSPISRRLSYFRKNCSVSFCYLFLICLISDGVSNRKKQNVIFQHYSTRSLFYHKNSLFSSYFRPRPYHQQEHIIQIRLFLTWKISIFFLKIIRIITKISYRKRRVRLCLYLHLSGQDNLHLIPWSGICQILNIYG